jgi:hypothetical protein
MTRRRWPIPSLAITQVEDAVAPIGPAGTLVSALTGGQSDVDTGARDGGCDHRRQYRSGPVVLFCRRRGRTGFPCRPCPTQRHCCWVPTDRVYFQPAPDANGSVRQRAHGARVGTRRPAAAAAPPTPAPRVAAARSRPAPTPSRSPLRRSTTHRWALDDMGSAVEAGGTANGTAGQRRDRQRADQRHRPGQCGQRRGTFTVTGAAHRHRGGQRYCRRCGRRTGWHLRQPDAERGRAATPTSSTRPIPRCRPCA